METERPIPGADDRYFLEHGELVPACAPPPTTTPASDQENIIPSYVDRPVPGLMIAPGELTRQQQELIRLQLANSECRTSDYSTQVSRMHTGSSDIRMTDVTTTYHGAPMDVDPSRVPSPAAIDPPRSPREPLQILGSRDRQPDIMRGRYGDRFFLPSAPADVAPGPPALLPLPDQAGPPPVALPTAIIGHFDDPDALLRGLAPERVRTLSSHDPFTVLVVTIFNGGAPRTTNIKSQSDALTAALTAILAGATNFVVVPPAAACGEQLLAQDQPTAWLVLRLTPDQAEHALAGRVWTSRAISFLAYRPGPRFDRFIGRVGYFTHNADNDIEVSIRRLFDGPLVRPSIRALLSARDDIPVAELDPLVDYIVSNIDVVVVSYPNGNIIANVFCDAPTFSVEAYRAWADYLRSLSVWCDLNPIGNFLRPVRCGGCLCADHPTVLCPLPLVSGWLGPAAGAATIEGSITPHLGVPRPPAPSGRGAPAGRGNHPYRGGNTRGRRGRGRGFAF